MAVDRLDLQFVSARLHAGHHSAVAAVLYFQIRPLPLSTLILCVMLTACHDRSGTPSPGISSNQSDAAASSRKAHLVRPPAPADRISRSLEESRHVEAAPNINETAAVDTQVNDVKLSNRSDGKTLTGRIASQFSTDDGVFIAIRTQGKANHYTLTSRWMASNGKKLVEYSQNIATAGPVETVFSLNRPDGWPKGSYSVELLINGKPARTVPFIVR